MTTTKVKCGKTASVAAGATKWAMSAALAILLFLAAKNHFSSTPVKVTGSPTQVETQVFDRLVVMKVRVGDILEAGKGDEHASWIVLGDALVTVDGRAIDMRRDDENKIIHVIVPNPVVSQPRVDEEKTMLWHADLGWFSSDEEIVLDEEARRHAQRIVARQVMEGPYLQQAKSRAEDLIRRLFAVDGYTCSITWHSTGEIDNARSAARGDDS